MSDELDMASLGIKIATKVLHFKTFLLLTLIFEFLLFGYALLFPSVLRIIGAFSFSIACFIIFKSSGLNKTAGGE